jgi:hypothetical protein
MCASDTNDQSSHRRRELGSTQASSIPCIRSLVDDVRDWRGSGYIISIGSFLDMQGTDPGPLQWCIARIYEDPMRLPGGAPVDRARQERAGWMPFGARGLVSSRPHMGMPMTAAATAPEPPNEIRIDPNSLLRYMACGGLTVCAADRAERIRAAVQFLRSVKKGAS